MSNKGVSVGVVSIFAVLISVGFISAGFFDDLFSFGSGDEDLKGELRESFDVGVTLSNSPPVVLSIYDVENEGGGGTDDIIDARACDAGDSINNAKITFLVRDENGIDDLPGDPGFDIDQSTAPGQVGVTTNLEVLVKNPGTDYVSVSKMAEAGSCVRDATCAKSQAGAGCATNEMEYACTVAMQYYDEPSAASDWSIRVDVADVSDAVGDSTSLTLEERTFDYLAISEFRINSPAGLNFPTIDVTATDIASSNDPVVLGSCGNIGYTSGTLHASDLTSDDTVPSGDNLPASAFSVSLDTGVGGDALLDECAGFGNPNKGVDGETADDLSTSAVTIDASGTPTLPYGEGEAPSVIEELYVCLWKQLDTTGLTFDNTYSSTVAKGTTPGTAGHAWELVLS
jgi:hypothetical protein